VVEDVVVKKFTFTISSPDEFLFLYSLFATVRTTFLSLYVVPYKQLERCNPWPHVANRHMSISQLLSSCCCLFTVLNSGLPFYTKRVSTTPTTPSQTRPLPSPTHCGVNSSIEIDKLQRATLKLTVDTNIKVGLSLLRANIDRSRLALTMFWRCRSKLLDQNCESCFIYLKSTRH